MRETVLINGMPRPISDTNESYTPTRINADETPLNIAKFKKELEDKIYTTLCQERMQMSKNLEGFQQKIERLETIVSRLESETITLNSQLLDVQGVVQRGKIVL